MWVTGFSCINLVLKCLLHQWCFTMCFSSWHDVTNFFQEFEIRELAICTIGRLSSLNPAYIMPSLRKTLIQVNELILPSGRCIVFKINYFGCGVVAITASFKLEFVSVDFWGRKKNPSSQGWLWDWANSVIPAKLLQCTAFQMDWSHDLLWFDSCMLCRCYYMFCPFPLIPAGNWLRCC